MRSLADDLGLAQGLADRLPPGTVHLHEPVAGVRSDDDSEVIEAASGTVAAGHAVLALPPALAVEAIAFTRPCPRRFATSLPAPRCG